MTLKSDAKFKEKLKCGFKYDMKDIVNFPKYIRFELEKIQSYLSWNWTVMQKSNKSCDLGVSEMAFGELGIGWNFIRALKSLRNCTLMGSFSPKNIIFKLENFRVIMCHETESWCKF